MTDSPRLRSQLIDHLNGGMAFLPIDKLIAKIPYNKLNVVPAHMPYSLWQQFWHMMYAQKDILEFSVNPEYTERTWPDEYWPAEPDPTGPDEWKQAVRDFRDDRAQLIDLIKAESTDLLAPLKNDASKNLLREVLLVIEHNAYHTGQILVIMRALGIYN